MNNKFMKIAIEEARKGIMKEHGGPFGAVIVKDNVIISKGHNHVISNNDPTCHGEIDAIRKACKKLNTFDLSGCVIYTTGFPCIMCMGAILWANISKIYYGCNTLDTKELLNFRDEDFKENIDNYYNNLCEELDRDSCIKLYKEYSKLNNKKHY